MRSIFTLFFLLLVGCPVFLRATVHVINFSYPSYSVTGISVLVGDTITWKGDFSKFPLSSVAVPDGANAFGCQSGNVFSYVVKAVGTYKYQCDTYKNDGMVAYFTASLTEKADTRGGSAMVYINYFGHAFHLVTSDAIPHNDYTVTIASVTGLKIYEGVLKAQEKDKWIATEAFPSGTYILTATDGTHSFGRKFSK